MVNAKLLWIDCSGGLLAGAVVLVARPWLAALYALPDDLLLVIGLANLLYGSFSLSLATMPRRRTALRICGLALANALWAVGCFIAGAVHLRTASVFGLAHLLGEGVLVGALGVLEWRARERLITARARRRRAGLPTDDEVVG